jgi:hypothetical protein
VTLFDDPTIVEPTPFDRGMAASERAARARWTPEQLDQVNAAIEAAARRHPSFTSDDVWAELGDGFPVTKGLASLLTAAKRRGVIASTGEVRMSSRGGDHDHGQRLVVWRSLIHEGDPT